MAKKLTTRQRRAFYSLIDGWVEARKQRDSAIARMENCQEIIEMLKHIDKRCAEQKDRQ